MDMSLTSDNDGTDGSGIAFPRSTSRVRYGAVAIGRNEGQRLVRCLKSLSDADTVVFVDSGSTDNSAEASRQPGADVVEFDLGIPFTAARARKREPERSIYNWLCDREWSGPVGVRSCTRTSLQQSCTSVGARDRDVRQHL